MSWPRRRPGTSWFSTTIRPSPTAPSTRASSSSSATCRRRPSWSSPAAGIRRCRWPGCGPAASSSRCGPTICGSPPTRPPPWCRRSRIRRSTTRRIGPVASGPKAGRRVCSWPGCPPRQSGSQRGGRPVRGDDRHLFDYFTSEVLPALVPAQRDLLVRAAPLELLSGSLCDAALRGAGLGGAAGRARARRHVRRRAGRRPRVVPLSPPAARRTPAWTGRQDAAATRGVLGRAARWFADTAGSTKPSAICSWPATKPRRRAAAAHQSWFFDHGWAATFLGTRRAVGRSRGPSAAGAAAVVRGEDQRPSGSGRSLARRRANGRSTTTPSSTAGGAHGPRR